MDAVQSLWTVAVRRAGDLACQVPAAARYEIEAMKVSGDLDGTDLLLLRDMAGRDMYGGETAGRLRHLDLSEAGSGGAGRLPAGMSC